MTFTKRISLATVAGFALLASNPAFARNAESPVVEVETAEQSNGPALWKVADEDTTIYMFGTVHMLPDDVDWNSGVVNEALASADTLVTELNMTPEVEAEIGKVFGERGTLPEGQTLRGLMTDEQLETYVAGMGKLGIPAEALDSLKPWYASIALLGAVLPATGFTPEKGVETVLEKAVGPDVKRVGLETVELQVDVFDGLPIDKQMVYFLEFAADPIEGIKGLQVLVDEWAAGNADEVGNIMNQAMSGSPELAERLLYNRNKNWAEWIDARLDEPGTVFMAVGAGHLAGEKSVQDYLVARGIQTTREQ